jgi:protein-tyrosine kinase
MSSLIEQAAERLEQLRQAGVIVPPVALESAESLRSAPAPAAFADPAGAQPAAPLATIMANPTVGSPLAREQSAARKSERVEFDLDSLAAANLVTPSAPRSQVADEFRVIKRPLINNVKLRVADAPGHANLIMVTSAVAGEGKSFTAINLAMSIAAELDHTVMLVDADLARPSLPRMLRVAEGPGLLDLLDGSAHVADVLLRTNVEKLTLLRSGTPHAKATELLASDAMRRLVDEMSRRYKDRIIIFDSPPLLLTTEARALAMYMGQIVFVVRAAKTLQSAVQHAMATIEACPLKMMLLNQTRPEKHGAYSEYGLGYGYGYGYGGSPTRHGA